MTNGERLPEPPTALIGRVPELAAARRALLVEPVRLLTLTGAAGSWKTRLALEIARNVTASFDDGVCWVDLAPITDASLVMHTVAGGAVERIGDGHQVADGVVLARGHAVERVRRGEHMPRVVVGVLGAVATAIGQAREMPDGVVGVASLAQAALRSGTESTSRFVLYNSANACGSSGRAK